MASNLCKDCKQAPRMGPLQSRCLKCQKTRLRAKEQAKKEGKAFIYDRAFMADTPEKRAALEAEGRPFAVRLKMPRVGQCQFHDLVRGDCSFEWSDELCEAE